MSHDYCSKAGLKARGWTEAQIRDILGEPDHTVTNPHYGSAAPMQLFSLRRVQAAERKGAWRKAQQLLARRRAGRLKPSDVTLARSLKVKLSDARARAAERCCSAADLLLRLKGLRRAREERLAQERCLLSPAYVAPIALPLLVGLCPDQVLARGLEILFALNRLAKRIGPSVRGEELQERIYSVKDRFIAALVDAGDGAVFQFQRSTTFGSCCRGVPIRAGERCYECYELVSDDVVTWCLVEFVGQEKTYRFHVPPDQVTEAMLRRAQPIPAHDPTQPIREVPEIGITAEQGIAVVAYVAQEVAAGLLNLTPEKLAWREQLRERQAQERPTRVAAGKAGSP